MFVGPSPSSFEGLALTTNANSPSRLSAETDRPWSMPIPADSSAATLDYEALWTAALAPPAPNKAGRAWSPAAFRAFMRVHEDLAPDTVDFKLRLLRAAVASHSFKPELFFGPVETARLAGKEEAERLLSCRVEEGLGNEGFPLDGSK